MSSQLNQPLLPKSTNGDKPNGDKKKGADITATCINLLKNMVGAGLLNVCVAFKYASVLGGLLDMILSAFLCTCGFLLIGYCCAKTGAKSFRALMTVSLGESAGNVMDVILFFHTLFSCVGYVTLIGDFTTKSSEGLLPGTFFATSRAWATIVIVVVIVFPLSLLKNLEPLKWTSAFGLAAIAFSVLYVIFEFFWTASETGPMQNITDSFWYLKFDTFKTIALFNGSFSAHYNAPTYYAELKDKRFRTYAIVAFISFGIATVLFTVFGLIGFARWGDGVLGNVLKAYDGNSFFVQFSWMCMNFATIFVFPLAFQRMRSSFVALVGKPLGITDGSLSATVFLLGLSCYLGIAFTDIAIIKMIKGATLGVSIMFIMPGLAYLGISNWEMERRNNPWDFTQQSESTRKQCSPRREVMKNEPVAAIRLFSYVMIVVGVQQGVFALLSHYKII